MVIQHNLSAMNATRQLNMVNSAFAHSVEVLSSGYRVNRAADDAAGLAISEKMRRQIRGLTQASRNAQDGISMVQTTEGALNEVHDMLQRMNELCIQAANDTNTTEDRAYIQQEIHALQQELDRVGDATEFNTIKLLKGLPQNTGYAMPPDVTINGGSPGYITYGSDSNSVLYVLNSLPENGDIIGVTTGDTTVYYEVGKTAGPDDTVDGTSPGTALPTTVGGAYSSIATSLTRANVAQDDVEQVTVSYLSSGEHAGEFRIRFDGPLPVNLQVGTEKDQTLRFLLYETNAASLGVDQIDVSGADPAGAMNGIDLVKNAISINSSHRAALGAVQNRLEHTIRNLDNVVENTTAAESRIRDQEMGQAMVEMAKHNILTQVGQTMLSQANQTQQGVLSLLQ